MSERIDRYRITSPKDGRVYIVQRQEHDHGGGGFSLYVQPLPARTMTEWRNQPDFIADVRCHAPFGSSDFPYMRIHSRVDSRMRGTGLGAALYLCAAYATGADFYRGVYSPLDSRTEDAQRIWDTLRRHGLAMRVRRRTASPLLIDLLHADTARDTGLVQEL